MAEPTTPPSPTPSQLPPVPASPTYSYASTANRLSQYALPLPPPPRPPHAVLTKADMANSQAAYTDLLATAKSYRLALASLSAAASAFGSALEACARLKEARADIMAPPGALGMTSSFAAQDATCTADGLLAASGLQHLVANHQQILSETVYRAFEVPLLHELDRWRAVVDEEGAAYDRAVREQSREIRRLERDGQRLHRRQRRRDVAGFRDHLVRLTARLDGLTALHADHAAALLREGQATSSRVLDASCSLVRAEVDIFEGLARKGWTGGGLEDVLERGVDLFAVDDPSAPHAAADADLAAAGGRLFSILPPKSILADAASASSADGVRPATGPLHPRADSLGDGRYQSLAAAIGASGPPETADAARRRLGGVLPLSPAPPHVMLSTEALVGGGPGHDGDGVEGEEERGLGRLGEERGNADVASLSLTLEPVGDEEDVEGVGGQRRKGEGEEEDQELSQKEEQLGRPRGQDVSGDDSTESWRERDRQRDEDGES